MNKASSLCTVEPPHSHLLALPSELLINDILSCLPIPSLSACSQTCKFLNCLISSSLLLTYFKELAIAGMLHNPRCPYETYPISKRLDMLREKERRWLCLRPKWRRQMPVILSSRYDTHGIVPGHVLLGTPFNVVGAVSSMRLPSERDGEVHWKLTNIGQHIINFTVALEEHNLIACLTCTNPNHPSSFQVHLLNHSTGEHHSSASMPIIRVPVPHIQQAEDVQGDISVCGENLAISVKYPITADSTSIRRLQIWNWESGILKAEFELESEFLRSVGLGAPGLTFLREDILLNPNPVMNSLDVYHIPYTPLVSGTAVRMIARFNLPKLSKYLQDYLLLCHLSPSPCSSARRHTPSEKPFTNDPERSILGLAFHVLKNGRWSMSSLFIRWQYLLTRSLKHLVEINESLRTDTSCLVCRWDEWGPQNSRLFPERPLSFSIMSTNGSRWVSLTKNTGRSSKGSRANLPCKTEVYDFNSAQIRSVAQQAVRVKYQGRSTRVVQLTTLEDNESDSDHSANPSPFVELVDSPSVYPTPNDTFTESVETHLPYLRTTYSNPGLGKGVFKKKQKKLDEWIKNRFHRQGSASHSAEGSSAMVGEANPVYNPPLRPDLCSWDGILVDDERIIGSMFDGGDVCINELDILYLG